MITEAVTSLIITITLLLGSPGPAPLALAATGATYGIKQGIAFLLGILMGLACAIVGATLGLASLFSAFPEIKLICQLLGGTYIGYVAFKIATAPVVSHSSNKSLNAPNFKDGLILNLINPKLYAAFLAIFSQFLVPLSSTTTSYLATGLICFIVATLVDILWLGFGSLLKPVFAHPVQARAIRIIFAALMIAAVLYAFLL